MEWKVWEKLGNVVINESAISKFEFDLGSDQPPSILDKIERLKKELNKD